ncbi:aldo/keto reductase [Vibrio sp. ZSDZ34]|uniref:Aldo/keto reductase n=1 Tax=Vibrio gelatinilyticus TaxID=2893468 RepID=A0A9X1WCS8_9VIBR|nr:aldo/keto reductase [Vibrio gelatinilyticus]MCJ2377646.1 aldo/keto reductase [Vibrio gelatinilyticus]
MKHNTIEKIGLEVPSLTFGGASIANLFLNLSNTQANDTVEAAIKAGFRYFDTAPHYGAGLSELRLGLGLRALSRGEYILSTKVGRLLAPREEGLEAGEFFHEENPFNRVYDYTYEGIMTSFEHSVQRLGTRYIDLLHVHDLGTYTHGETDAERKHFNDFITSGVFALEELKAKGLIKGYGLGANEEQIFLELFEAGFRPDVVMLANRYNLLEPNREEFFAACRQHQVSVAVAAPFATGVLVAGVKKASSLYEYGQVPESVVKKVEAIESICKRHSVPIGAVALQFPLRNPSVVTVTCGVATPEQAQMNMQWASMSIPDAVWADLAEIGIK